MRIKYLFHEWPKKAHVILTSCKVSPEHLTACRLIALIAFASNPSLNFCMLGNFSCFCWRLQPVFFFFKIIFFQSVLIWVKIASICYQQKTVSVACSKERVKRTCKTIHWAVVCYSKVMLIDSYMGQFMRFWYFCTPKKDVDEGSC